MTKFSRDVVLAHAFTENVIGKCDGISATLRQVHRANIAMSPHQGVLSGIVRLNKIISFDLVLIIAQLLSSRIVRGVQILVYIYRHSQHLQTTKIANAKPNQPYQVLTAL